MRVFTVCGSVLSLLILISCQKTISKNLSKDLAVDERGCLALKSPSWQSAVGQVDTNFATNGLHNFSGVSTGATGVYVQNDGSILSVTPLDDITVGLFKFLSNGQLDLSFGNSGRAADPSGSLQFVYPVDVIADCSNNIYVAAIARSIGSGNQFGIGKYLPNGQFDPNFGTQGIAVNFNESNHDFMPYKILMQKDGKFIVIGTRQVSTISPFEIAAARFHSNGQIDNSFGTNGIMSILLADTEINAGAILPDNRFIMVGTQQSSCAVIRFNSNGAIDHTFGTQGVATFKFTNTPGNYSSCFAVRRLPNQSALIVSGDSYDTAPDFGVAKILENGTLDPTFNGGKLTLDFGYQDYGNSVQIDFDEKIYVSGRSTIGASQDRISVARLNNNGTLDNTFGTSGKFSYNFAPSTTYSRAMAIAPSGKIVFTGLLFQSGFQFMLTQTK